MAYETIDLSVRDGVAYLTLNRPDAANSITVELARDLMYATLRCDEDASVRAVLLTGAGRMFCGGGDLKTFASKGDALPEYLKEVTTYLHAAMSRLTRMNEFAALAASNERASGDGQSLFAADSSIRRASSSSTAHQRLP